MRRTRIVAGWTAALIITGAPVVRASTPTGTPSNPATWGTSKPNVPKVEHRPVRTHKSGGARSVPHGVPHGMPMPRHSSPFVHQGDPGAMLADPLVSPELRTSTEPGADRERERRRRAERAHQRARDLLAAGKHDEAIEQLDLATELEPTWSAPLQLRAETFGELARRYQPSEVFLTAEAADLQRLLALEPNVDVVARSQRLLAARAGVADAARKEARRRKMTAPAVILGTVSAGLFLGGVILAASTVPPADSEVPGRHRYMITGIAMAAGGLALAPAAITLAVLGGRQSRRDDTTREILSHTGRPHPTLALSPAGIRLQF